MNPETETKIKKLAEELRKMQTTMTKMLEEDPELKKNKLFKDGRNSAWAAYHEISNSLFPQF